MDAEQWQQAEGRECPICGLPFVETDEVVLGADAADPRWRDEVLHKGCEDRWERSKHF